MKKLFIISISGLFLFTSCGKTTETVEETISLPAFEMSSEETSSGTETSIAAGSDKEITIPSTLLGSELDASEGSVQESGVDDNGNVTYQINLADLAHIVSSISATTEESIQSILSDDTNYPHINDISVDKEYSEFTIHMSGSDMTPFESMLVMSFYTVGNKYQIYCGADFSTVVTTVIYINDDTGEEISRSDSSSMN